MENKILLTGFGGQGIQFAGKFLAQIAIYLGKTITVMPSYGPETRGGTSYCGVIISDAEIFTPIVTRPDILICMNTPSLEKFEGSVVTGGLIILDSSLIDRAVARSDVREINIPATKLADDNGIKALANMIIIGKMARETGFCGMEEFREAMGEVVSEKKKDLYEANLKALELGYEYTERRLTCGT
ncbi:MAG: 2-oxoacid:acceptor oxidoreductase family protein [Defluviitaleaceae bacterium]|nr:2-oxoacid:acceptor oxidoreductase family protein [Defluviitaleaceae bacterium]